MKDLIDSISAAIEPGASNDTRAKGADACRAILTALDPPMAASIPAASSVNPTAVANIVGALRGVPPDQLLDLAIAKLRSALPAGTELPTVAPLKFHMVPVQPRRSP